MVSECGHTEKMMGGRRRKSRRTRRAGLSKNATTALGLLASAGLINNFSKTSKKGKNLLKKLKYSKIGGAHRAARHSARRSARRAARRSARRSARRAARRSARRAARRSARRSAH